MSQPALFETHQPDPAPKPAGIAPWLRDHLVRIGAWNIDGVGRKARASQCDQCRAWVLVGLDGDRCAGVAVAEATPTDTLGEVVAILAGRLTYRMYAIGSRIELDYRSPMHIAGAKKPGVDIDVHAEHRCGHPLPAVASVQPMSRLTSANYDGDPPF